MEDEINSQDPLGKTAYYDPNSFEITIYTTNRHPKDILRSLSHELVHHCQNLKGMFKGVGQASEGYAQKNPKLRELEREAFEKGNMVFRDFEDGKKSNILMREGREFEPIRNWKVIDKNNNEYYFKNILEKDVINECKSIFKENYKIKPSNLLFEMKGAK